MGIGALAVGLTALVVLAPQLELLQLSKGVFTQHQPPAADLQLKRLIL